MTQTLLEKAKNVRTKVRFDIELTDQHIELALSWIKEEISNKAVAGALGFIGPNYSSRVMQFIVKAMQKAYEDGKIKIIN